MEYESSAVENFSRKLGIVRDPFNNKDYNGNYCEFFLKYIHILKEQVSQELQPFITVLKCIKEVKEACFGPQLKSNYKVAIDSFEQAWYDIYIEFEISFSNKCHVNIKHVPQMIEKTGQSLYFFF